MAFVQSGVTDFASRIPEIWAPLMYDELRNSLKFANIFERKYEGNLRGMGDVVRVQQWVAPTGAILTDDEADFSTEAVQMNDFSITVNKRAHAAYDITDLAQLQSMDFARQAQEGLVYAVKKQLEQDIIAALLPAVANNIAPIAVSDLAAEDITAMRTLFSTGLLPESERFLLLAPSYNGDLLNKTQLVSSDFVTANSVQEGAVRRFGGFDIMEHNLLAADVGFAVHPSALQLVMQQDMRVKISDLHAVGKYAYRVSVDFVYGFQMFDDTRIIKISG